MFAEVKVIVAGQSVSVLIEEEPPMAGALPRLPCFIVGLSSHYHDKFSETFRSVYKLVLIDLYWTNDQFSSDYTDTLDMETLSDHMEQVRGQLENQLGDEYQKIFVLGHSAYGFISLDYGLKYPERTWGIINVASPLIFNSKLALRWQEEYIDSNFGNPQVGGPTPRWHAYYQKKMAFAEEQPSPTKKYFVSSYLSKGPLFFNNPALWQNQQGQAEKMWEPWHISIADKITKTAREEKKDINMPMISHYIQLLENKESYTKLAMVEVPVLWVIALGDLRVSLYQLEDRRMQDLSKHVEFFHPADASHWPMLSEDSDTREFDSKVINWGEHIWEYAYPERPSAGISR